MFDISNYPLTCFCTIKVYNNVLLLQNYIKHKTYILHNLVSILNSQSKCITSKKNLLLIYSSIFWSIYIICHSIFFNHATHIFYDRILCDIHIAPIDSCSFTIFNLFVTTCVAFHYARAWCRLMCKTSSVIFQLLRICMHTMACVAVFSLFLLLVYIQRDSWCLAILWSKKWFCSCRVIGSQIVLRVHTQTYTHSRCLSV